MYTSITAGVCCRSMACHVEDALNSLIEAIEATNIPPGYFIVFISPVHGSESGEGGVMLWSKSKAQPHKTKKVSAYVQTSLMQLLPLLCEAKLRRVHLHYCFSSESINAFDVHVVRNGNLRQLTTSPPPFDLTFTAEYILLDVDVIDDDD